MNSIGIICMVKNESEKIVQTLKIFIDYGFTKIFVNDTGSTDDTCEKITEYYNNVVILKTSFTNFADSRNKTIKLAKVMLNDIKYLLFLDVEWYAENLDSLINFVENITDSTPDFYDIDIQMSDGILNKLPRLINVNSNCEYKGELHEQLFGISGGLIPNFKFNVIQTEYGLNKTYRRNITYDIPHYLEKEDKTELDYFYLAQAYHNTKQYLEAIDYYLFIKKDKLIRYVALYRIGECYLQLKSFSNALFFYTNAIIVNPKRCEAYVRVAQIHDDVEKYNISKITLSLTMNRDDLFIDNTMWTYTRYIEFCKGCVINKKFKKGLKVLSTLPVNEETIKLKMQLSRKIVILILNSPGYEKQNEIMREYLRRYDIKYYFYSYSNVDDDLILEDEILFSGEETFIPGILTKTIKVFQLFKMFDYIVRLNASTFIDLTKLDFDSRNNNDYFGYFNSTELKVNEKYGVTQDFLSKNGSFPFVSGKCIILSKKAIDFLLKSELDYSVMDDVAISLALHREFPIEYINSYGEDCIIKSI